MSPTDRGDARADAAAALLAGVVGWVLLGPACVDPRRVEWLLHGDAATHLLGWLFLRNAPAADALRGTLHDYLYPVGTTVALTDSIPLVALPLRLVSGLWGAPTQYLGLWLLGAFALQGLAASRLLRVLGLAGSERVMGALLFAMFPPLAWRMAGADLGHASLCMHAPLLLGLSWLLAPPRSPARHHLRWGALAVSMCAVHVYLAAMVFALYAAHSASLAWQRRTPAADLAPMALVVTLAAALLGWLGVLGGVRGGPLGYGVYVAPLDAMLDSRGFSAVVPALHAAVTQTEGYGYLGLGATALVILALVLPRDPERAPTSSPSWRVVAGVAAAFALFSLSSRVHVGATVVLDASALTRPVESALQSLRATGRFVWVPLYALLAWAVMRAATARRGPWVLAACVALQAAEMLPAYARWRPPPSRAFRAEHPAWRASAARYRHLAVLPPRVVNTGCRNPAMPWPVLVGYGLLAADNRWSLNGGYSGRPARAAHDRACALAVEGALRGVHPADTVQVFTQPALYEAFRAAAGDAVRCGTIDGAQVCVDATRPSPLRDALTTSSASVLATPRAAD